MLSSTLAEDEAPSRVLMNWSCALTISKSNEVSCSSESIFLEARASSSGSSWFSGPAAVSSLIIVCERTVTSAPASVLSVLSVEGSWETCAVMSLPVEVSADKSSSNLGIAG